MITRPADTGLTSTCESWGLDASLATSQWYWYGLGTN